MKKSILLISLLALAVLACYQSVKLDESIKYVAPALQSQREVKNPRENNISDELIRTYLKENLGMLGFVIDNETLTGLLVEKEKPQNSKKSEPVNLSAPKMVKNVVVTAYASCDSIPKGIKNYKKIRKRNGTGTGITKSGERADDEVILASGKKVKKNIVAADTDYYPEGTLFYVPETGKTFEVKDTGAGVKGRHHIDIYIDRYEDAIKWGNPKLKVWVKIAQK